jgi:hypothetical protein
MLLFLNNLLVQSFQQINLTRQSGVTLFNQVLLVIIVVEATHHVESDLLLAFRIQLQLRNPWQLFLPRQLQ